MDDIRKLFMELRGQGKTMLIASHNREDIEILCDVVYEMDAGVLKPYTCAAPSTERTVPVI